MPVKTEAKIIDNKIVIKFKNLVPDMIDAIQDELYIGANNIRNKIIKGMQKTKRAPWFYWRGKKPGRKKHFPSAPGEMPAIDSGELISRIVAEARKDEVEVGVEAGAPYAVFLEEGTDKMEARPFLEPTAEEETPIIERNVLKAIEQSAKDTFK